MHQLPMKQEIYQKHYVLRYDHPDAKSEKKNCCRKTAAFLKVQQKSYLELAKAGTIQSQKPQSLRLHFPG